MGKAAVNRARSVWIAVASAPLGFARQDDFKFHPRKSSPGNAQNKSRFHRFELS
jgi:hypothetical protein